MIMYVEHPTFDFDISVDVYSNSELLLPMTITNVERLTIANERAAKIHGYVEVDVPIDACSARLTKRIINLSEVIREAQRRNIKEVTARCKYRIILTNDDWSRIERDGFNARDVTYVITLRSYTTFDNTVIMFDDAHWSVFAGHLQRQVHASLLSKCNELRPTSTVTTRRI